MKFNLVNILGEDIPDNEPIPTAKDGYTGPFKEEPEEGHKGVESRDYYVSAGVKLVDIVFGDDDEDDTDNVYTFRAR